jgi:hypothetical protein
VTNRRNTNYRARPGYVTHREPKGGAPIPFVEHRFVGSGTSCVLCFGWRDDPRHWCDEVKTWNVFGLLRGTPWEVPAPTVQRVGAVEMRVDEQAWERLRGARQRRFVEESSVVRSMVAT